MTSGSILVSRGDHPVLTQYILPGADLLLAKLREGVLGGGVLERFRSGSMGSDKPVYLVTPACRHEAAEVRNKVFLHVSTLLYKAGERREDPPPGRDDSGQGSPKGVVAATSPPAAAAHKQRAPSEEDGLCASSPASQPQGRSDSPLLTPARRRTLDPTAALGASMDRSAHRADMLLDSRSLLLEAFPDAPDEAAFYRRFVGSQMYEAYCSGPAGMLASPLRRSHSRSRRSSSEGADSLGSTLSSLSPPISAQHSLEEEDALLQSMRDRSATISFGARVISLEPGQPPGRGREPPGRAAPVGVRRPFSEDAPTLEDWNALTGGGG